MRPENIDLINEVSAPLVHPSGTWVLTSVSHADFRTDSAVGQLWRVPVDGSPARRLTRGQLDRSPAFSPDGSVIGFLRANDGKPQLHLVEAEGGEPLCITDQPLGVSEFAFSPDGRRVAFVARVPEENRYGQNPEIDAGAEDPRHFTGNKLQMNGLGWANGRPAQLFVVDVPALDAEPPVKSIGRHAKALKADAEPGADPVKQALVPQPKRLTDDELDWRTPTWTPDGSGVVVVGSAHADHESTIIGEPYLVKVKGKARPKPLLNVDKRPKTWLTGHSICFSRDGEHLFLVAADLGAKGLDFVGHHGTVWVMPAAGGKAKRLTDLDLTVMGGLRPFGPDGVIFADEFRGRGRAFTVTAKGVLDEIATDGWSVLDAHEDAGVVALTVASAISPGEVATVQAGAFQVLTDFAAELREGTSIVEPVEFTASSDDGYPVHGWVLKPKGKGPHPVLLNIHGGPYAAYHETFFDEFQVYVEAGYAVVACNPRGSAGYGTAHGRAIKDDMGNLDMRDILAFLDAAVASDKALDGDRVGIMGGSYGGYMTAWIIGHDSRWKGAIVERGYLDGESFVGSSDIGWFFPLEYSGRTDEALRAQSPMRLTSQVRTPTLVLHSELDLRCPLAQGLTYYGRLKEAGVDAEILIFPGENHELSRSGRPWHRRQRFEKILQWWDKHLPVAKPGKKGSAKQKW